MHYKLKSSFNYYEVKMNQRKYSKDHIGENFIVYELLPIYESQKSYYRKAIVIEDNYKNRYLQSYDTVVCMITRQGLIKLWDNWSLTTSKHIHDFLLQNGFSGYCKKDWLALEVGKPYQKDQAKKLFRIAETA